MGSGDSATLDAFIAEIGYIEGLLELETYSAVMGMGDFNTDIHSAVKWYSRRLQAFFSNWNLIAVGLDDSVYSGQSTWHSSDFRLDI